jgi:hypothetical protein
MKPTNEKFMATAGSLCRLLPFAPREDEDVVCLSEALGCYIETEDQLRWLTSTAVNTFDKWPGIKAFRDLFAAQFRPADEETVQLRDMAPELRYAIECGKRQDRQIAEWKAENQRRLLAGEVTEEEIEPPLELVRAAVKTLPKTKIDPLAPEYLRNAALAPSTRPERKSLTELESELAMQSKATRTPEETMALVRELEAQLGIDPAKQTIQ